MPSQTPKIPPHFIVFVPGILGSKLQHKQTKEVLWVDFSSIPWNPFQWKGWIEYILSNLKYPNDQLEPAGILDEVIFVPPWAKQEHYGRMFQALEKMGYKTNPKVCSEAELDVYPFAYDWRQDNRLSARQLGQAIERWRGFHPDKQVWIIAHSMGGMVSRWYIEKLGGKEHVGRLFLMGSPRDGAPKAMNLLFSGFDTLFRRRFNLFNIGVLTRELVRTFPSAYQLLPYEDPFLRDENNQSVDLYTALEWLENDQQRAMLLDGRKFNQDLGKTLGVETICFFGTKKTTTTAGLVQFMAQGRWRDIRWDMTGAGDGTVPERSAVHPNAREKYPLHVGHGDIYINPGVLEKLEWELYRKYNLGVLAAVKTDRLDIRFDPDKDLYSPGETIQLEAEVRLIENNAPVPGARIGVQLLWRQALPGAQVTPPQQALPAVQLSGSPDKTGVYTGVLTAPNIEGYYQLQAKVEAPAEPAVLLEELILVEAEPTAVEGGAGGAGELPVKPEQPAPSSAAGMDEVDLELLLIQRERETRHGDQPRIRVRGGTLSGEPTASHIEAPAATPREPKPRCLSALLENHPMDRSLRLGELYTLSFLVDMEENPLVTQAVKAGRFPNDLVFQEGVQTVDLDVYLTSKDFRVLTKKRQVLRVPRTGPSRDRAYFKIEPKQEGEGEVTAVFLKENNFIHGVTLKLRVGGAGDAIVGSESLGRAPDSAFAVRKRGVCLLIKQRADQEFDATMISSGVGEATLHVTLLQLNHLIKEARKVLQDIVYLGVGNDGIPRVYPPKEEMESGGIKRVPPDLPRDVDLVYQSGPHIPLSVNQDALRRLARVGKQLYDGIFYSQGDLSTTRLGDQLRALAREPVRLKIQIVSQQFLLPWGILYLAENYDEDHIDPELFLGLKHIIEHIPLQRQMHVLDNEIDSRQRLTVSLNIDAGIDQGRPVQVLSDQLTYWDDLHKKGGTERVVRQTDKAVVDALADPKTADQILYFYSHAKSYQLDNGGKPGDSALYLTGGKALTLNDLKLKASTRRLLKGAPLVFLNACESAQLSPLFYGGFLEYFTTKGARGMIGTECEVPALFAAEWARRFFDQFLAGEKSLGQIMLDLRRKFYFEHNNLLGLLYALYCDGDTQVVPGLRLM